MSENEVAPQKSPLEAFPAGFNIGKVENLSMPIL